MHTLLVTQADLDALPPGEELAVVFDDTGRELAAVDGPGRVSASRPIRLVTRRVQADVAPAERRPTADDKIEALAELAGLKYEDVLDRARSARGAKGTE